MNPLALTILAAFLIVAAIAIRVGLAIEKRERERRDHILDRLPFPRPSVFR